MNQDNVYFFKVLIRGVFSILVLTGTGSLLIYFQNYIGIKSSTFASLISTLLLTAALVVDDRFDFGFSHSLSSWAFCKHGKRNAITIGDSFIIFSYIALIIYVLIDS